MTFETRVHVELQFSRSRLCPHHELRDGMKTAAFFADSTSSEKNFYCDQLTAKLRVNDQLDAQLRYIIRLLL